MDTDLDHVGGCMANHSKFIKLLLSFVIAISPIILINNVNAASLGGWTLGGGVAQGASTVYNGTKNVLINGKNVVQKGVATVTPTATNVAKVLRGGIAGYALSVAVEQLLGAVDWVLDPANNQIRYTEPNENGTEQPLPNIQYKSQDNVLYQTITALCSDYIPRSAFNTDYVFAGGARTVNNNAQPAPVAIGLRVQCDLKHRKQGYLTDTVGGWAVARTQAMPEEENEEKTLPLDVVAQQVISNAESGDTSAQVVTTSAAADIVSEAEKDNVKARPIVNQLESSAETATDETATGEATKPNTADPTAPPDVTNISLKFPVFCGWAPTVCQAASVVISFPTLVTEWWNTGKEKSESWASSISQAWTAAKEWATSEPSQENTQVDVENNNTQEIDTQVSFSTQCPAPINLANFSYHGISQSWTVDFSKFCDVFATYLKPVVISIGAFSAVLIVSGVGVRENG